MCYVYNTFMKVTSAWLYLEFNFRFCYSIISKLLLDLIVLPGNEAVQCGLFLSQVKSKIIKFSFPTFK